MNLLVEQCTRAVSSQRLETALPAGIHSAILCEYSPVCGDLFSTDVDVSSNPIASIAHSVLKKVEEREDPDDLQEWLEETHEGVDDVLQV